MAIAQPPSWITPEMRVAGFVQPSLDVHFKLDVCSIGREKQGKTHWAFTAPGPIAAISTDSGTEEIAEKFRRQGKEIAIYMYRVPKATDPKKDQEAEWGKVLRALDMVVRNKGIRSLIVDTATEVWELLRLARFGKLTQVKPHHYGPVNAEMRDLVKECCDRRTLNVIWINKMKKEYKTNTKGDDAWTGLFEMAGFGDMPYLADVVIRHLILADQAPPFGIKVEGMPRYGVETLFGMELSGEMSTFPMLAQLAHPDSDESDWE